MSKAKITLLGFYEWDSTLFDDIELTPLINKETLINNILLECGEFEVLYGNPKFYKNAVNHFFKLNFELFSRWATDLGREYNPLENYDRMEEWEDYSKNKSSENENTTTSMKNTTSNNNASNSTDLISSFDSVGLVEDNKNVFSGNSSNNSNANGTATRGTNSNNDTDSTHKGRIHGNIGVTTSQQMLESEMILRQKWQLLKIITDMFMNDLTIPVYE